MKKRNPKNLGLTLFGVSILPAASGINLGANLITLNQNILNDIENNYGIDAGIEVTPNGNIIFVKTSGNINNTTDLNNLNCK